MQEPEVSLRIAMKYIREGKTKCDVNVSIDGAHIKTKEAVHFDLMNFMNRNGYTNCNGNDGCWRGTYKTEDYTPGIVVSSTPGIGDVSITLKDGRTMYIESKKIKKGSGGEYPAMREAIGQIMTNCPDCFDVIPVVAVPYTEKSEALARKWSKNKRIRNAEICFMLVHDNGEITFVNGDE